MIFLNGESKRCEFSLYSFSLEVPDHPSYSGRREVAIMLHVCSMYIHVTFVTQVMSCFLKAMVWKKRAKYSF